jgi:hypothetical protein
MSDDESRRAVLDNEIAALNGQLGEVRGRMEKAYELLDSGAATDFVAKKLRELEVSVIECFETDGGVNYRSDRLIIF